MPYTIRTLTGSSPNDWLHPSFRKITFDDSFAIVLVSTQLRLAWTALPGEDASVAAVGAFIKASQTRSEEERNAILQNPDTNDISSPWRQAIYHNWNHVFYDIGNFLTQVGPGMGRLNPPAHEVLVVHYHNSKLEVAGGEAEVGLKVVWETNVLVLPAHLELGISLRITEVRAEAEETKTIGMFDGSNGAEILYIKEGTEVRISVDGDYDKSRRGVAAVLVYGKLTTSSSEEEEEEEEEVCWCMGN